VVVELAPAYGLNGTSSIVRTGHVCPAKAILLSPPASPLMKAQWKLATAKSITGLVRAQWPSEAEARFIRSPRLHWTIVLRGRYPPNARLQTQRI